YLFLVLAGCGRAFSGPARSSLLPQVVPADTLGNAVTWNSSGWQFANVVGPALGGLVLALGDRDAVAAVLGALPFPRPLEAPPALADPAAVVYLLSALLSLACVALLAPVRPRDVPRPPLARSLASLLSGARFVRQTKLLLAAITLDLFAVLLGGATALLPI